MTHSPDFADTIRSARAKADKSQSAFADLVGVSRTAVQGWERRTYVPDQSRLQIISRVLGLDYTELARLAADAALAIVRSRSKSVAA